MSSQTLWEIASYPKLEDLTIIEKFFDKEFERVLEEVNEDMDDNNQDSIDTLAKANIRKKKRYCPKMHISENVPANRKKCTRENCNEYLVELPEEVPMKPIDETHDDMTKVKRKAKDYMHITCNIPEQKPKEVAMGAYEVNPNTMERIKLVMDKLLEDVEMKNKHAVKLSFKDKEVVKELNPDTEIRKWATQQLFQILQFNNKLGKEPPFLTK